MTESIFLGRDATRAGQTDQKKICSGLSHEAQAVRIVDAAVTRIQTAERQHATPRQFFRLLKLNPASTPRRERL